MSESNENASCVSEQSYVFARLVWQPPNGISSQSFVHFPFLPSVSWGRWPYAHIMAAGLRGITSAFQVVGKGQKNKWKRAEGNLLSLTLLLKLMSWRIKPVFNLKKIYYIFYILFYRWILLTSLSCKEIWGGARRRKGERRKEARNVNGHIGDQVEK